MREEKKNNKQQSLEPEELSLEDLEQVSGGKRCEDVNLSMGSIKKSLSTEINVPHL